MPECKKKRAAQALLLVAVFAANSIFALKLPTPPSFPCNSGVAYPGTLPTGPGEYCNPVTMPAGQDLADPAVIRYGGRYYMTGTGPGHYTGAIRMWSSPDLVSWTDEGVVYAAPRNPGDWNMFMFWAAEIFVYNGNFYLSYSAAADEVMQHHRIGIAMSASITGPYVDMRDGPLFDLHQETIDQHLTEHSGTPYMYYTNHDASARGIYVVQLAADLNGTVGPHVRVLEKAGDETLIEAPWLVSRGGVYHLLFSANGADTAEYRVGHATSSSPLGPFTRRGCVLTKNWWIPGPGHCSAVPSPDGKELFIAYHAKKDWSKGWAREVCIDRLFFDEDGGLHAFGPTRDPQPLPSGSNGSAGVVPLVNPGFEMAGLPGWEAELSWDATIYAALVADPVASRPVPAGQCVFQGQRMLWFWSLASHSCSLRQDVIGMEGNASYRLVAWGSSSGRLARIGIETGATTLASDTIGGPAIERVSLDFLLPAGESGITIEVSSPAGAPGSWAWLDAFELYPVPP
ncbi:MAG: family 43 glycosylhydrolase [Candidatus Lokiarchaeota archaeon]|nr:family 43 glycosylhydrolase [Candidatus Lokiarchaeota archaeon]